MMLSRRPICTRLATPVALVLLLAGVSTAPRLATHMYRIYSKSVVVCGEKNQSLLAHEIELATSKGARVDSIVLQSYTNCFDRMSYVYTAAYNAKIEKGDNGAFVVVVFLMLVFLGCFLR